MSDAVETLVRAGLPLTSQAPPAALARWDAGAAGRALSGIEIAALGARTRDALLAWLRALEQHWPSCFRTLGPAAPRLAAQLEGLATDRNRYLKLRRIALANLTRLMSA